MVGLVPLTSYIVFNEFFVEIDEEGNISKNFFSNYDR